MKLSQVVEDVIRLGEACRKYWDRELPLRHPDYPIVREEEGTVPPPHQEAEIASLLQRLPADQIYTLLLLAYIGRGDFGTEQMQEAYHSLKDNFANIDHAISQLVSNHAIAEYLTDAAEDLRNRHIDLDCLSFADAVIAG